MIGTNTELSFNFLRREYTKSNLPPATCWIHEKNYQGTLSTYAGGGFLGGAAVVAGHNFLSFLFAALMSGSCFGGEQRRLEQVRSRKAENALRAGKVLFHDGGERAKRASL